MEKFIFKIIGIYLNILVKIFPKKAGKHSFHIFCFPSRVLFRKSHKAYLDQYKWYDFEFDGDTIQMYKWGSGPKKLLMVHGWQSSAYRWKRYIDKIDLEQFTVIAFDAPGHGLSSSNQCNVPIYVKLLNQVLISIPKIDVLIGHSIGAFACVESLYEYEINHVDKLVLLASPTKAEDFIAYYRQVCGLKEAVVDQMRAFMFKKYKLSFDYFNAKDFAKYLKLPGLIIHDKFDKDTPYEGSVMIHKLWKNSNLIITEGYGHQVNKPEIIAMINDFILSKEEANVPLLSTL